MSYAIIETGGKQLLVEPGRFYDIELLAVEAEAQVTIDKVLLVQHNGDVTIGQPFVEGATVEGTVMRHRRGKKIIVYKMRPKKKTRKKRGHRQEITQLMIDSITLNGSVVASKQEATGGTQVAGTIAPPEPPQTLEIAPVAEDPAVVEAAPEETVSTATEAAASDAAPAFDEPDAQTVEPDAAQESVESVTAEEPDAETVNPEQSAESESQ